MLSVVNVTIFGNNALWILPLFKCWTQWTYFILLLKLIVSCLHELGLLINLHLLFITTLLHAIVVVYKLLIGYKKVHFRDFNKVILTRKTSFHAKSKMIYNFAIHLFLVSRYVFDRITLSPQFVVMWRCKRNPCIWL